MNKETSIKLFEQKQIRSVWNDNEEKWYFSIVDVVGVLTEQPTHQRARNYWKVMKSRLVKEGNQTVTNCNRLKLLAEEKTGKKNVNNKNAKIIDSGKNKSIDEK